MTSPLASSQEVAIRYLRRRLWKAFQEDNAEDALRVYTATRMDYETMMAEDAAALAEQTREENERLEARPPSMRKFGALLRSTSGSMRGIKKSSRNERRRLGTNDSDGGAVEDSAESVTNHSAESTTCLLQETMNPSELFVPDDFKDPSANYELDEPPVQESEQDRKNKAKRPRTVNRARPRLSFQLFSSRRNMRMDDEKADEDSSVESEAEEPESTTTPLHEAARIGCAALVRLMLAHDGRPNFRNGRLRTVLHMAAGGLTKTEEEQMRAWRIEQGLADMDDDEILGEDVGIRAPIEENEENNMPPTATKTTSKKAAQVVGRFFKRKRRRSKEGSETEIVPVVTPQFNQSLVKTMEAERMDTILAVMSWNHPEDGSSSAGEGASVNTVDSRDRTALHYAAELGRPDICLTLTSSFGTMLTVVDETSRTPCELAAEQSHEELAAQLEARALLFVDPYGMDDELMVSVLAADALSRNLGSEERDQMSGRIWRHWRKKLAEPFSLFATWTPEEVQEEREARVFRTLDIMQSIVAQIDGLKIHSDAPLDSLANVDQDHGYPVHNIQALADAGNEAVTDSVEGGGTETTPVPDDDHSVGSADNAAAEAEAEAEDGVAFCETRFASNVSVGVDVNESQTDSEVASAELESLSNVAAAVDDETRVNTSSDLENIEGDPEVEDLHLGADAQGEQVDGVAQNGRDLAISQVDTSEVTPNKKLETAINISCLQACHAEKLLLHHGFDVDAAIKSFRSDPRSSLDEAGLTLPENNADNEPISEGAPAKICLICCEEFESSSPEWRDLKCCKHGFCLTCLQGYIQQASVTRELGVCLYCPHHACRSLLSPQELNDLAPNMDTYTALTKAADENFVSAAGDMRFCPHAGCPGIVKRLLPDVVKSAHIDPMFVGMMGAVCTSCDIDGDENIPMTYDGMRDFNYTSMSRDALQPRRAHRFCFACGTHEPHWPATCELMESWKAKVQEEVELVGEGKTDSYEDIAQQLWLRTNTRPCPKCEAPIEKVEGCNHMTCKNRHCKYEFCWICRQDWKLHNTATGGFFRCNKWQEEKDHEFYSEKPPPTTEQENEDDDDPANQATRYGTAMHSNLTTQRNKYKLERFLHRYRRWNAHAESAALERRMGDSVCARLMPVVDAARDFQGDPEFDFGGRGLSFVHAAFTELLECRSVLGHSYIFAYFRYPPLLFIRRGRPVKFRQREKMVFEQFQADLEIVTEHLSDIVARAHLRATQTQIMFLTSGAAEKRRDFSNLMLTILHDELREQTYANANDRPTLSVSDDDDGPYESMMRGATKKMLVLELFPETAIRAGLDLPIEPFGDGADVYNELERVVRQSLNLGEPEHQQAHALDPSYRWAQWSCPACTYANIGGSHCAMCDTPRE